MSVAWIESLGLFAPGLVGWAQGQPVLAGERDYAPEPLPKYKPTLLPANERRRATALVRLAFGACEDAIGERLAEAVGLAAVFAASGGDYTINDQICRSLLQPQPMLSPTQFHNSVHNAAAGYWSIATGSRAPSVSLSACDSTVAAGLIEALTLVAVEQQPTLLALYDDAVSWPMQAKRPVSQPFSAALWLTPEQTDQSVAALRMALSDEQESEDALADPGLEALRRDNPAARCLPLLGLLARRGTGAVQFVTAAGQSLQLDIEAC